MSDNIDQDQAELTRILNGADPATIGQILTDWLADLRLLAAKQMKRERVGHTLQGTAMVNEIYLKLAKVAEPWRDRSHFLGVAAHVMRNILVDYARTRHRHKRAGGRQRIELEAVNLADLTRRDPELILALDEAVQKLTRRDEELGTIVRLRFYAGLTINEVAREIGTSPETVKRRWEYARGLLYSMLEADFGPPQSSKT